MIFDASRLPHVSAADPSPAGVPPAEFRLALGRFATGVTVVTAHIDGRPHGMTVNAFTSVSLVPPLVAVCVDRSAALHPALDSLTAFGVSILETTQQRLSAWFADPARPTGAAQFTDIDWRPGGVTGVPLIGRAAATLECARDAVHPAGDHSIVLGRVLATAVDHDAAPLLYLDGAYLDGPAPTDQ